MGIYCRGCEQDTTCICCCKCTTKGFIALLISWLFFLYPFISWLDDSDINDTTLKILLGLGSVFLIIALYFYGCKAKWVWTIKVEEFHRIAA